MEGAVLEREVNSNTTFNIKFVKVQVYKDACNVKISSNEEYFFRKIIYEKNNQIKKLKLDQTLACLQAFSRSIKNSIPGMYDGLDCFDATWPWRRN